MLGMLKRVRANQRGFTLIELLVVILIVGILAAVGVPLYIGYTRDAKLAEGKALAGSVFTALQACVQAKGGKDGVNCTVADVRTRAGLNTSNFTGDNRWEVTAAVMELSSNAWLGNIDIVGRGSDNPVGLTLSSGAGGSFIRCNTSGAGAPGASGGEQC